MFLRFFLYVALFTYSLQVLQAQIQSAEVYWVGHSLVNSRDWDDPAARNMPDVLYDFSVFSGKNFDDYQHVTPGAPIGWNWGATPQAWNDVNSLFPPLIDTQHPRYGTFDVMVVTERVDIRNLYDDGDYASAFFARKFYAAAKNANPDTRLFMYENWPSYNGLPPYYPPPTQYDYVQFIRDSHPDWLRIMDEAADPDVLMATSYYPTVLANYTYLGTGQDPGNSDDKFIINIIPVGTIFANILERIEADYPSDDWSFPQAVANGSLSALDFFENPLRYWPNDLSTLVYPNESHDDIHPTPLLIYLNALVHYAVIYRENPENLPVYFNIPEPIANIFKEEVLRAGAIKIHVLCYNK
ncbi:MAG: hypothetical protein R2795_24710 [Saprospiraceae bacterium]